MKNLTMLKIAEICDSQLTGLNAGEVTGVVIDSRKVIPGSLFIATRGERVDGHDYIGVAVSKGAAGIICERKPSEDIDIPYIIVKDSFLALKKIAMAYRSMLTIPVVGITGSVGKTSTKEFIASVLSQKYRVHKTEGNYNNEIGLPLTILGIRDEDEAAVLEMGISEFGEMHRLSEMAKPDVVVITNIGMCHLENLKTRDGILKAKTEIFDFLAPNGTVCLNGDDDKLKTITEVHGKSPVFFGMGAQNTITAHNIVNHGLLGSNVTICTSRGEFDTSVPLPGEHMVQNALAATAVGLVLGLTIDQINQGIQTVEPVGGRSHIIKTDKNVIIDDCYNANPVSMKAAIDLLMTSGTRTVAILGDMFELGVNEQKMHGEVGAYAVTSGVDELVCVGERSCCMYQEACRNSTKTKCCHFENKKDLMSELSTLVCQGDTILVKASHAMGFEELIDVLQK